MRRIAQMAISISVLVAAAGLFAACGEDRDPADSPPAERGPGATPPESDGGSSDTADSAEPDAPPVVEKPVDLDVLRADHEGRLREMDRYGRGLLDSFRSRVYDPGRDGGLRFAEGVASVRSGSAQGSFALTWDATREADQRVVVIPGDGVDSLPAGSVSQVGQFAQIALDGAYRAVVNYRPPVRLLVTPSKDGQHRVVTAPPHQVDVQVSYSVDEADLVQIRGTSVRPAAEIAYFDWTFTRGRYVLAKQWLHGSDAVIEYEYDDRATPGVLLLVRATVRKGESAFDVSFRWDRVESNR